jgi:EAL domain-containing protein (putative c-di-GMP-specific phosphodiesterase class I)
MGSMSKAVDLPNIPSRERDAQKKTSTAGEAPPERRRHLPPETGETGVKADSAGKIERALEKEGFHLVYQPIVSLKGDSQEGYSVLLRLRDEDGTLHAAGAFLPAAIRSGRVVSVDRWVLAHAICELAAQRARGNRAHFFVNIAEQTLQEEKLLIWICDSLRGFQARGNWLTIQVLEEHVRRNAAVFAKLSEGLKKVKCRLAINRFGEGPSPEDLLRRVPVDYVRFPPDLGQGLTDDRRRQQRLRALTALASDARVRSIATGVQDAGSLTMLWNMGVDYVQGDILQRPGPSLLAREA